jgi:hypothetical protein
MALMPKQESLASLYLKNDADIVVHEADIRARVYGIALVLKTMPTSPSTRLMPKQESMASILP